MTRLATANGELLAVVRATASGAALSFGGVRPRRAQNTATDGRLRVAADAAGLASLRPVLPPSAQRALAGARRLVVWLSLGRGGATSR